MVVPLALFVALFVMLVWRPNWLLEPVQITIDLPSEKSIPATVPARPSIDTNNGQWKFRYSATGTEFRAGVPYWFFRIMPAIFDDEFAGGGYERFGLDDDGKEDYSQRPVPRGLALSDTELYLPFLHTTVTLKRVSITCSGCHRGEYFDAKGQLALIDGMPNVTADLQSFKRFFGRAFGDPRFTPERVVTEINKALASDKKPALTTEEKVLYTGLVDFVAALSRDPTSAWMDSRADNGPGRIDPFNAVKFEVLKVPDDGTAATLDFPSIWNQRTEMRSWHHCDGNTADSSARNFGSVVGVGGIPGSVRKVDVQAIGAWIDDLKPPPWPFAPPDPNAVKHGLELFTASCSGCHSIYDRATNKLTSRGANYMSVVKSVGTDSERWRAFRTGTAKALNDFGERNALWPPGAFRGAPDDQDYGYLAGPLDGIWARAPYLHNGSVPTVAELLKPPAERVRCFYRGNRHYDETNLGWVSTQDSEGGKPLFKYCTVQTPGDPASPPIPGNSNVGHPYTIDDAGNRADLIAYLKTL
jgi:hypothetical protein